MTKWRWIVVTLLAATAAPVSAQKPPPFLLITVEKIKPGGEAEYSRIEEDLAHMCERLGCPNSYLALESVKTPKEVYWLVTYASRADIDRVAAAYAENEALLTSLRELSAQKKDIADEPVVYLTEHRPEASNDAPWRSGATRFAVIVTLADAAPAAGAVFEAEDGSRFAVVSASTREEADVAARTLGQNAQVFEVRPSWSRPEREWVLANAELWQAR